MKIPSEANGADAKASQPPSDPRNDFSEYMWMANEEEFDKEVMKQLEEEALMEQCIEAMLEDERETAIDYDFAYDFHNLCLQEKVDLAKKSTLNPNAAEFVPGGSSGVLS